MCTRLRRGEKTRDPNTYRKVTLSISFTFQWPLLTFLLFSHPVLWQPTAKSCQCLKPYLQSFTAVLHRASFIECWETLPEWDSISIKLNWNKQRYIRNKNKCDQRRSDGWQDKLEGRLFQMARAAGKAQKQSTREGCLMREIHEEGRRCLEEKMEKVFCQLGA